MRYNKYFIQRTLFPVFLLFIFSELHAGDSVGVSTVSVIRLQMQSIADEVVNQAKLDSNGRVSLCVEGEEPRALAENAFIEALQKKKYSIVLNTGSSMDQTLRVFLLRSECKVRKCDTANYERRILTLLEVRTMIGKEREARLLRTFERETIDTAQVFPSVQISVVPVTEEESVIQQLLTPLIIVGGSILIVYLLFTVRS